MSKRKLTFVVLMSVLSAIVLSILIFYIVIFSFSSKEGKNDTIFPKELASWNSMIDDNTLITELVMPGSHDAGCYNMMYMAETQEYDIYGQLIRGARYFDIRVNNDNGEYVIFHNVINGVKYDSVLEDIKKFMSEYPSEFIILDFQHFKNESENKVFDMLEDKIGKEKLIINENGEKQIDNLTLGEVRGKILVTAGTNIEDYDREYLFNRNNSTVNENNSVLHSYYETKLNSYSSKKFISLSLSEYIARQKIVNSGLFVLQGQLTDNLLLRGPRFREATHSENMSKYVKSLKNSEDLEYINIVMRDFITSEKCREIIALNYYKNQVKTEYIDAFEKVFNIKN